MPDFTVRPWITSVALTISPRESLKRARALLRTAKVPDLLVVDDGRLVGTVSDHDIWEHCPTGALLLDEQQTDDLLEQLRVGGVMALHPPTITSDTPLREAAQLFATSGKHVLAVVENGAPIGVLTEERVMHALAMLLGEIESREGSGWSQ